VRLRLRLSVAADDDAAGIEIVVQRLGFPQKFRAEKDVVHAHHLAHMNSIADRDRGFDDNGGLRRPVCGAVPDQAQHILHGGAVKVIGLGIIVCGYGENNNVSVGIRGGAVRRGSEMELAFSGFGLGQVLFNILVLNGGTIIVDHLRLFGLRADGGNLIMLGEKHREGQPHVAHARDRDLICPVKRNGLAALLDKHLGQLKTERRGKRLQLGNGGGIGPVFQIGKDGTADAGLFGKLRLRELHCLPTGDNGLGKQP
jgi:hypothetical protein